MPKRPLASKASGPKRPGTDNAIVKAAKSSGEMLKQALSLARAESYDEAQKAIEAVLEKDPENVRAGSLKANILINLHKTGPARELCLRIIERDEWHFQSHLVLGMAARLEGDMEDAVRKLKEALYIKPSSWLAHYYLADAYQCLQRPDEACREYSLVIKNLDKGEMSDSGLDVFPLSVSPEQMKHLCRHNAERIRQREVTT